MAMTTTTDIFGHIRNLVPGKVVSQASASFETKTLARHAVDVFQSPIHTGQEGFSYLLGKKAPNTENLKHPTLGMPEGKPQGLLFTGAISKRSLSHRPQATSHSQG